MNRGRLTGQGSYPHPAIIHSIRPRFAEALACPPVGLIVFSYQVQRRTGLFQHILPIFTLKDRDPLVGKWLSRGVRLRAEGEDVEERGRIG